MTSGTHKKNPFFIGGRILFFVFLMAVAVLSGRFSDILNLHSLVFVLVGGTSLILMSFTVHEITAAFKAAGSPAGSSPENSRSFIFWESAARNFWMMGVLATLIFFVIALTNSKGGVEGIATRMASALIPTLYGGIFCVVCLVPALKLKEIHKDILVEKNEGWYGKGQKHVKVPFRLENVFGFVVFLALVVEKIIRTEFSSDSPIFSAWKWVIYWPSLLVVLGGAILLVLFVGNSARGKTLTLAFSVMGFLGLLIGIIQVLLGLSSRNIQDISAALTFIVSSCFFALMGMMLAGAPLEDWSVKDQKGEKHSTLSRVAWFIFPLTTLIFLVITFFLVITPVRK
ncbi:MAG: hypothetical protein JXB26_09245 [Candidatus Aminicenantes bacterium]|nr:hypothetical protein [Candidatus Aminicenantes bacterium]